MFHYEKKLQYPVNIKNTNPKLAKAIITQYGGPDGELGASLRYLSQRYAMPYPELRGLLTDIGTEVPYLHFFSSHGKVSGKRLKFTSIVCLSCTMILSNILR